ncbi:MAG: FumA C-terminus/TtdB family hydratase beta subunit [Deltaproteobacteria bacterium]|jgi:fumarate hydratase subunit beta|nr:FumA C-terminus/TtdB family hydratase beta subunit [Deltaproteobacteria bacterium]
MPEEAQAPIEPRQEKPFTLRLPLGPEDRALEALSSGDSLELEGELIVARDQAHLRLLAMMDRGEPLPFDPVGQAIFYMGPSPAPPGRIIGSAGPTTAGRMDPMTLPFLERGVKVLVGKGRRSQGVRDALFRYGAVYLAAIGGAGALYSERIGRVEVLAFPELGPEALLRISVSAFPAVVIHDLRGGDQYESGPKAYRTQGDTW